MSKLSQQQKIIAYCKAHGSITNRDAITMLHINSPTKRISEIREDPRYDVQVEDVPVYDEDGRRVSHYYEYTITEVTNEDKELPGSV